MKPRVLDLFSGIGGFSLGLERAGFETVAFCEIEEYPRKVLAKHWPDVPIHKDITQLDGKKYRGTVDVVCGGFPCQPFSVAGKRAGAEDDRALWPEMLRVIREVQPTWVIGENVIGLESMGLEHCVSDLENNGFAVQVFDIPACGVGAIHRRHRLWIVAYAGCFNSVWGGHRGTKNNGTENEWGDKTFRSKNRIISKMGQKNLGGYAANTNSPHSQGNGSAERSKQERAGFNNRIGWPTEPPVCGADDGIPNRAHRLRALGNAVVPQIPEMIGRAIKAHLQEAMPRD